MKKDAGFVGADETPMPGFVLNALGVVGREREFKTEPRGVGRQPAGGRGGLETLFDVGFAVGGVPQIQRQARGVFGMSWRRDPAGGLSFGTVSFHRPVKEGFLVGHGAEPRNGDDPHPGFAGGVGHLQERLGGRGEKFHPPSGIAVKPRIGQPGGGGFRIRLVAIARRRFSTGGQAQNGQSPGQG